MDDLQRPLNTNVDRSLIGSSSKLATAPETVVMSMDKQAVI